MSNSIMLGYDYSFLRKHGLKVPLYAPLNSHFIIVGGSGSGKSTAILYWLYKASKFDCDLSIVDFKASHDFIGITEEFAEFEASYNMIKTYYDNFINTPEGGNKKVQILLIDEVAGLLSYYSVSKEGKKKADEIRSMMSSILMLGRSRKCFIWLSMQRYSANIFPPSSGSGDNFHVYVGLGNLSVDGRKGLFAGEHLSCEDELHFGQGRGIALIDGQTLKGIIIPKVSKKRLRELMC